MLTEAKLRTLKPEAKLYKITDRDGLYIAVAPSGRITFRYNYRINGRQETLTLGRYGYPDGMSLSEARDKLVRAKEELQKGVSPSRKKTREKRAVALEDSFRAWAKLWFEKYQQAESTKDMRLAIYNRDIEPRFGSLKMSEITHDDQRDDWIISACFGRSQHTQAFSPGRLPATQPENSPRRSGQGAVRHRLWHQPLSGWQSADRGDGS